MPGLKGEGWAFISTDPLESQEACQGVRSKLYWGGRGEQLPETLLTGFLPSRTLRAEMVAEGVEGQVGGWGVLFELLEAAEFGGLMT